LSCVDAGCAAEENIRPDDPLVWEFPPGGLDIMTVTGKYIEKYLKATGGADNKPGGGGGVVSSSVAVPNGMGTRSESGRLHDNGGSPWAGAYKLEDCMSSPRYQEWARLMCRRILPKKDLTGSVKAAKPTGMEIRSPGGDLISMGWRA